MKKRRQASIVLERLCAEDGNSEIWLARPPVPPKEMVIELLQMIECLIFPDFFHYFGSNKNKFTCKLMKKTTDCISICTWQRTEQCEKIAEEIFLSLPSVKKMLIKDAISMYEGDPAASSVTEVVLCYPGFLAVMIYRIAHLFFENSIPFMPRILTEHAHRITGIDIHPGATIGESFCIDHGTGIVIGETARIGDRVKIYQGVTIGAKSFESDEHGILIKGKKRHPDIGNDCIIYANATILGGDTVIGDRSIIGGNVWLTHSLPENSRVYYKEK